MNDCTDPNIPVWNTTPPTPTNKDLLVECLKDKWCGCRGLDLPSVREILSGVVTQSVDGCLSLNISIPPTPTIDVSGILCGGTTETITVKDEADTKVFIDGAKSPIPVCVVNDKDVATAQKCDVNTGNTILIRSVFDDDTNTWENPTYFDLVLGATWTGNPATDLTECQGNQLESDAIAGCDGGVAVTQWVVKDNGEPTGVVYYTNTITGAIVTPVAWTVGACVSLKTAQVPNCDGSSTPQDVDNITATYLLNQENKHTETVYDVLTAVFGGTVAFTYTALLNVAVSYASVTLANDTVLSYWTDFGDGYNDVGPSPDHSYNADGAYEIKGYAITQSGNKVLLYAKEVTIVGGVITYSGANPHTVARTYTTLVASAFQNYCNDLLVGSAYNADGTAYTQVGGFVASAPIIIDELEDNADYQALIVNPAITLRSGGVSIANGTFAAGLGPDGTSWTNPGNLKSITVVARKSNNSDAIPGSGANQVMVQTADNKFILLEGETYTWSVEDGNILDLVSVDTLSNSAASITYIRE